MFEFKGMGDIDVRSRSALTSSGIIRFNQI